MRVKSMFILIFSLILSLSLSNSELCAKLLFEDDFEAEEVGKEPSKWKQEVGAGATPQIAIIKKDFFDKENKMMMTPQGEVFYVAGDKSWTDYIYEWDWMFFADDQSGPGMGWRYQCTSKLYRAKRSGANIEIAIKNPDWKVLSTAPAIFVKKKWFRVQVTIIEDKITLKTKERDDGTPFENIEPLIELTDDQIKNGNISTAACQAFVDNVVVYSNSKAVEPVGKLSTTWATIKSSY